MMGKSVHPKAHHAALSGGNTFVCKGVRVNLLLMEKSVCCWFIQMVSMVCVFNYVPFILYSYYYLNVTFFFFDYAHARIGASIGSKWCAML